MKSEALVRCVLAEAKRVNDDLPDWVSQCPVEPLQLTLLKTMSGYIQGMHRAAALVALESGDTLADVERISKEMGLE